MFNLAAVVDFLRVAVVMGVLCLSGGYACASEIVFLYAFRGEVNPCACCGMS